MKRVLITALAVFSFTNLVNAQCSPVFTGEPGNIHTYPDAGLCTGTITFADPAFTGCATGSLIQTAGLPSGSVFPLGTTTNTFEVVEEVVYFEEDFSDNSAGWTLDAEWEIGPAVAVQCGSAWSEDPGTDTSPTADNGIAGVVIGGCANTIIHPFYYITSPIINTTGSTNLTLDLYRWLNSDYTPYMQNNIEVWNGSSWVVVWQTGGAPNIDDNEWNLMSLNIQAQSNAALQIRIGFNINSSGVYTVGSWNLDDVKIYDFSPTGVTYSFDVNISNMAPEIFCPSDVTVPNSTGLTCTEQVNYAVPTVTSCNAETTTLTSGLNSGDLFPQGTTVVEYTSTQNTPSYTLFLEEDFADNSAGWTLDTEWEIGPAVVSSCPQGNQDPGVDHSPSADNGIAGVVIGGCADVSLHPFYYITSPVVNTSGATTLYLDFYRWLNSDYTPFMQNNVEVFDGTTWQVIWSTGAFPGIEDNAWMYQSFDILAYSNDNLQVRFGFNVDNGGAYTIGSWNLDDVVIYGDAALSASCSFNVTVDPYQSYESTTICEGDSLVFGTQILGAAGSYTETFLNASGCDSIAVLDLSIDVAPVVTLVSTTEEVTGNDGAIDIQVTSANAFSVNWVTGETTEDISGLAGGWYYVTVTDDVTGCSTSDSVFVNSVVGIQNLVSNNVNLYPNPNNGTFIVTTGDYVFNNITLTDRLGRVVARFNGINQSDYKIELVGLEPGMYQVSIETDNGLIIKNTVIH